MKFVAIAALRWILQREGRQTEKRTD